ncbi:hypothetical protein CDD82_1255 [Ophiocordyceps australis]|uniref:RING-type E3 ubiquitin transferase n=1 Tax=Ophiocordyceps australis TaxID=1399860 RepID=A0A2C5ZPB2_9HYPO|nr:hypothetical protein CDD82_1255 [Ophiocordyceps australis]
MFTQPFASPPPGPSTALPSRPSRLRGLSYLRNYTHNHLLSRDSRPPLDASAGQPHRPANQSSASSASSASSTRSSAAASPPTAAGLARSVSCSLAPTSAMHTPGSRLTLIGTSVVLPPLAADLEPKPDTTGPHSPQPADQHQHMAATMAGPRTEPPASDSPAAAPLPSDASPPSSIRFSSYFDPRSSRPSLLFPPVSRTLPSGSETIRVGRYSERDGLANAPANQPSAAPVGFKSKVVSRRHCEFWCEDGKWYIKDVKSSSGTFLNHIRLSPPSQESRAYQVNDGDIVQLGIDFKGGEEMIFRCVKMRIELNRGWQNKLNVFNVAAHKRLWKIAAGGASSSAISGSNSTAGSNSQDCSICLNSIAPCQSLFVAPCSHTWHFKCIRSLLLSPQYSIFICPNCRASADLEADVDEPEEEWQQLDQGQHDMQEAPEEAVNEAAVPRRPSSEPIGDGTPDADVLDQTMISAPSDSASNVSTNSHAATDPLPIDNPSSGSGRAAHLRDEQCPSPSCNGEGPITPRNNAGPWVFDGGAGTRAVDSQIPEMRSLDAAADLHINRQESSDDSV